jgi:hypothetical protein
MTEHTQFYSLNVGIQGEDGAVEELRKYLDKGGKAVKSFFPETARSQNPLKEGGREFSVEEEDDVPLEDPQTFLDALSKAHPALNLFAYGDIDDDNGNGCAYWLYQKGKLIEDEEYFYYGEYCGDYTNTHIPADSCGDWLREKLDFFIAGDGAARTALDAAEAKFQSMHELFGSYEDIVSGETLDLSYCERPLDVLELLANCGTIDPGGIEKIDFSGQELEELPDLRGLGFTGLKTLDLSDTGLRELPGYL